MAWISITSSPTTLFDTKRFGSELQWWQTSGMFSEHWNGHCNFSSTWKPSSSRICRYGARMRPVSTGHDLTPIVLVPSSLPNARGRCISWSETNRNERSSGTFVLFNLNRPRRKHNVASKAMEGSSAGAGTSRHLIRVTVKCLYISKHLPRRIMAITGAATADSDQTFPSQDEGEDRAVDEARGKQRVIPGKPSPEIEPADVVQTQLKALQERDIMTVFEFTSPKNKAHTGPLSHFTEMIQGRAYNVMLGHTSADILSTLSIDPGRFQQRILIKGANGNQVVFSWSLSKQESDPFEGCWMTDSIHRDE